MFVVPPNAGEGDLVRIGRRPPPAHWMVREGYLFIPENRLWDADEREWISRAIGLHSILPSAWATGCDKWWKRAAQTFLDGGLDAALRQAQVDARL